MKRILPLYRTELIVLAIYLFLTIIFTYPLIFKIGSSIYGYTSDNFSAAWYFWWLKYASQKGLDPSFVNILGYPFGMQYGALVLEDSWIAIAKLLTTNFNELVAMNSLLFVSFPLAGMATYGLSNYLWKNKLAAFWAGLVFSFAPYHFWQGYSHLSLAFIYTLPLYLWSLIYFDRNKSTKAALFMALAFILTLSSTFYYAFFVGILTVSYFGLRIFFAFLNKENYLNFKRIYLLGLALVVVVILFLPTLVNFYLANHGTTSQSFTATGMGSLNDFLSLSLRPWDLLLPAPDHPFLGNLSQTVYQWITQLSDSYKTKSAFLPERVDYLGFTPVTLFLIGLWIAWKKKVEKGQIIFLTILLIIIFSFALPPLLTIRGINIYLPSYLLYLYTPNLRSIVRLGIVILLLVSVIGSYSVSYILTHFQKGYKKYVVTCLLSILVLIEFLPIPPSKVTPLDKPPDYYQFIKNMPSDTVIAEFPPKFDMADALIWQRYHQKPLFNMFNGEYHQLWDVVGSLQSPIHADLLSALGVNSVVFHTKYLYSGKHPFDELYYTRYAAPPTIKKIDGQQIDVKEFPWLKLEKEFDRARIYHLPATNSLVAAYNPIRSEKFVYPAGQNWELVKKENYLYILNFGKSNEKVLLNWRTNFTQDKLSRIFYNEVQTAQLSGSYLTLKVGLNIVRVDTGCTDCALKAEIDISVIR